MKQMRDDIVALLPAAGHGRRMGSAVPKQYLQLNNQSVLACTLQRVLAVPAVSAAVVVAASDETAKLESLIPSARITAGGSTRAESVYNGLVFIRDELSHHGLVLIHDAARPCVRVSDVNRLVQEVGSSQDGGLLAIPVHDTLKVGDGFVVERTVSRENMWRAVTPQLFLLENLLDAMEQARESGLSITDEASAMEFAGYRPRLVAGATDNIKITVADDLPLARTILNTQENT